MQLQKKKDIKLLNVMFPIWALYTVPSTWIVMMPLNFVINSIVLIVAMFVLKMEDKKDFFIRSIFMLFCLGFLADLLASIAMWAAVLIWDVGGDTGESLLLTIPGLILAGGLIYLFDYIGPFRSLEKERRKLLSLVFAIGTAPYVFLLPSGWLYR